MEVAAVTQGMQRARPRIALGLGLAALLLVLASPVSAERTATSQLAAQSHPRIVIHPRRHYPGPDAKRHCVSWLAREYRVSGPVITPQMRCWWR